MTAAAASHKVTRTRVLVAFAAVYLVWGSTYLAIRVAIETLPPLLMAGTRFAIAGTILYLWERRRGAAAPTRLHWRSAAIIGGFMLLGGNGGVVWAEQRVPSGLAALLIATVPLWMALLAWWRGDAARPSGRIGLGLLLGLTGVTLLVAARGLGDARGVDPVGAAVLVIAALSWAHGSLVSRHAPLPRSPFLATGMEMLCGGVLLAVAGLARGEWGSFDPATVSVRSVAALFYLLVFGSFIGFTAYIYLLGATTPSRAATYAFVNPLVAVILGWAVAGESLSPRTLWAAGIIVAGVVLIVTAGNRLPARRQVDTAPSVRPVTRVTDDDEPGTLDEAASARL